MRELAGAVAALGCCGEALADSSTGPLEADSIIVTAPGGLSHGQSERAINRREIMSTGRPDLLRAIARNFPDVSLQEAQSNPFQPNIVRRGFTASPLQGQPQGLAVYVDGGRFNQPFGDTVQFDLLPEAAIAELEFTDTNTVYGLNALGGAIAIRTKTGRDAPGGFVSAGAGDYGAEESAAEAGWGGRRASAYIALQRRHEHGWRRFSPSTVHNAFVDLGWDGAHGGARLKSAFADSDLTGNGAAPVDLLDADYRAVFTHPDNTRNRYMRVSVHPWIDVAAGARLTAGIYRQRFRQTTLNGDAADIAPCEEMAGLLCLETADDEESLLRSEDGRSIPAFSSSVAYGLLNRSRTESQTTSFLLQIEDRRAPGPHENRLAAGISHDRGRTDFASSSELGSLTAARSVEGLGQVVAQPDGSISPVALIAHTRRLGVYFTDRLALSDAIAIELGGRWNGAKIELVDLVGDALDGRHRFDRFNPGAALQWRPAENFQLRAAYSESNRTPTPAEFACADETSPCSLTNFFVADPPLKQVVARSFDLGAEAVAGPFDWRVSAYRITNDNDIRFVASSVRGRAFFRNVGATRRQGVETMISIATETLSFQAGYAYTDATFRSAFVTYSPDNPLADGNGLTEVAARDRLPGVPAHRGVVSIDYQTGGWSLGGDVQIESGRFFFGDEANLAPRTGSFAVANLRGAFRLIDSAFLYWEASNVWNERYATFGAFAETGEIDLVEAPEADDPRSLSPGAPRRWFIGLRTSF